MKTGTPLGDIDVYLSQHGFIYILVVVDIVCACVYRCMSRDRAQGAAGGRLKVLKVSSLFSHRCLS